jgi:hypothetical protein
MKCVLVTRLVGGALCSIMLHEDCLGFLQKRIKQLVLSSRNIEKREVLLADVIARIFL